jgi:hypothetical protein
VTEFENRVLMKMFGPENKEAAGGWRKLQKGKAIPLQPWTGPEGSRRLRLPDFKTVST